MRVEHVDKISEVCYKMEQEVKFKNAMVFENEYDGKTYYSIGISNKKYENGQVTDEWVRAYMNVSFPRNNVPINKQRIDITRAFFSAYEGRKDGKGKFRLVVQEWNPHEDNESEYPWG